jgi:hypothetical protein
MRVSQLFRYPSHPFIAVAQDVDAHIVQARSAFGRTLI